MWIKTNKIIIDSEKVLAYGIHTFVFSPECEVFAKFAGEDINSAQLWVCESEEECKSILDFIYRSLICDAAGIDLVKFMEENHVD